MNNPSDNVRLDASLQKLVARDELMPVYLVLIKRSLSRLFIGIATANVRISSFYAVIEAQEENHSEESVIPYLVFPLNSMIGLINLRSNSNRNAS